MGVIFMAYSIRLTEEERGLADAYAKMKGMSVAEAFKRALFEKMEDEFDLRVAESAYGNYLKDKKTYSHDEAWEEIMK